ncbi:MAG: HAD-IA family hydrolase [Clostridia bacterium]|nr:HAD-IA family hydrolase [Clostridia bacterium]
MRGALLFDTASYDSDIENYIVPFLQELCITSDMLKYVFVSHNHCDHAGGLNEFMKRYPETCIISRCPKIKEQYGDYNVLVPEDGETVLGVLRAVTIPGHTMDCCAIYDTRTKTMISGDCLQLYGIYGSGEWGSSISFPKSHIDAVNKLQKMGIQHILTAHEYHPYGYSYEGETVKKALDVCVDALNEIKDMILKNPHADDGEISALRNSLNLPTLGAHIVSAVRRELLEMKCNTYLFDFDGTLVDSMPSFVSVMLRILDENNIKYGDDIVKIITPLGYGGTAEYFNKLGVPTSKEEMMKVMNEYAYNEYAYNIGAKANVVAVLTELKERGASLNVLTASPHSVLDICLKRLQMYELFDNVWSCDDFLTTKADPQIYVKAAEKLGVPVDSVLFLDDNYNADKTAKSAGMKVCGVYDSSSAEYVDEIKSVADHYIYDFKELLNI